MRFRNSLKLAGLGLLLLAGGAKADSITNGSFETGDFTGWENNDFGTNDNTGPGIVATSVPFISAEDGVYFAALGTFGTPGSLIQTGIPTTVGSPYTLSFWLASDGSTPTDFSATFDGTQLTVPELTNLPGGPYTLYSFVVTPNTTSSTVEFDYQNDPGYLGLDNVALNLGANVVPLPKAAWGGFFALGILAFVGLAKRRVA